MNWKDITAMGGALVTLLITVFSMWYQLDSKIETRIGGLDTKFETKFERIDTKFDALNKLLTDNLIAINRDIGELKGQAHLGICNKRREGKRGNVIHTCHNNEDADANPMI